MSFFQSRIEYNFFLKFSSQNMDISLSHRKVSSNHTAVPTTCWIHFLDFLTILFWECYLVRMQKNYFYDVWKYFHQQVHQKKYIGEKINYDRCDLFKYPPQHSFSNVLYHQNSGKASCRHVGPLAITYLKISANFRHNIFFLCVWHECISIFFLI